MIALGTSGRDKRGAANASVRETRDNNKSATATPAIKALAIADQADCFLDRGRVDDCMVEADGETIAPIGEWTAGNDDKVEAANARKV